MHSTRGWERRNSASAGPTRPGGERSEGAHPDRPALPDLRQAGRFDPLAQTSSARRTYGSRLLPSPVRPDEAGADEERAAQLVLQREDARADGRLADAERDRGRG